ncbi:hypothetical protein VNI00_006451 [Paramarasmius palmivorus]|uniref:Uncharacterized protein n=1 Tax=Paramarasmius palmivorus TaxID=297713 RepID=A0AAW0D5F8_9AGAR
MAYEYSVSSLIFNSSSSLSPLDRSLLNISFSGQFRRPCYSIKTEMPESIRKYLTDEQKAMLAERELQRKSATSNTPAADGPACGSHGTSFDRYGNIGLGRPSISNSVTLKTNTKMSTETHMNTNTVSKHGDTDIPAKNKTKSYSALGLGRPALTNTATGSVNKILATDNKLEANKASSKKATIGGLGIGLPSTCGSRRPKRHNRRLSTSTMFKTARFARRRLFTIPEEGLEMARFSPRRSPKVKEFDMRKVHIGMILV